MGVIIGSRAAHETHRAAKMRLSKYAKKFGPQSHMHRDPRFIAVSRGAGQDTDDAQRATGVDEPLHTSAYWSMLETAVPDSRARIGPAEAFAVIRPPAPDRVGPTAQRMAPGSRKKAGEAHTISPLS